MTSSGTTPPPIHISDILDEIAAGLREKAEDSRAAYEAERNFTVKMGHYGAATALIDAAAVFREAASKARTGEVGQ